MKRLNLLSLSLRRQQTCRSSIAAVDCTTPLTATGSIGSEAGIVAAVVICLVAVVGVMILFGACLWRNDFCTGGRNAA